MFDPDDRPQAHRAGEELEVTFAGQAVKSDDGVLVDSICRWIRQIIRSIGARP